ncbi:MAG TPA: substrate binding domain-containing protein [Anaeromyxobacter sp.]|nr:substrate binding domain-containing protein [Anaeromyxobacter sp.]
MMRAVSVRIGALADSTLVARRLGRSRMVVCGAPAYLRRKGRPRSLDDLEGHDRLAAAWNGQPLPWRLRQGGAVRELAPGRRVLVDGAEALIELAVAGAGLLWACEFMVARPLAAGALVEVLAEAACEEVPVYAVSLPGRAALPKVRAFVEAVAEELRAGAARAHASTRSP